MISEIVVLVADEYSAFQNRILGFLENEGFKVSVLSNPNVRGSGASSVHRAESLLPSGTRADDEDKLRPLAGKGTNRSPALFLPMPVKQLSLLRAHREHVPPNILRSTLNQSFEC